MRREGSELPSVDVVVVVAIPRTHDEKLFSGGGGAVVMASRRDKRGKERSNLFMQGASGVEKCALSKDCG